MLLNKYDIQHLITEILSQISYKEIKITFELKTLIPLWRIKPRELELRNKDTNHNNKETL